MTYATNGWAALADPTRRTIFERLIERPSAVGELARELPVSRPAVSAADNASDRIGISDTVQPAREAGSFVARIALLTTDGYRSVLWRKWRATVEEDGHYSFAVAL